MNIIKFVVKPALDSNGTRTGKWYVLEVAGNGEPDGVSQLYTRKSSAKDAATRHANRLKPAFNVAVVVEK